MRKFKKIKPTTSISQSSKFTCGRICITEEFGSIFTKSLEACKLDADLFDVNSFELYQELVQTLRAVQPDTVLNLLKASFEKVYDDISKEFATDQADSFSSTMSEYIRCLYE